MAPRMASADKVLCAFGQGALLREATPLYSRRQGANSPRPCANCFLTGTSGAAILQFDS